MSVITRLFSGFFLFLICILPNQVQAVAIEPSANDVAVEVGGESTTTFTVLNDQDRAITFHFDSVLATFAGESDAPKFSETPAEIVTWLKIDPAIATIEPGKFQAVTMTIKPSSPAIDQTLVLGLRAVGDEMDGGAVKVREGVIGLVFVTIGSTGEASGKLIDFTLADRDFWRSGATVYSTITNTGKTILKPTGTITIQNALGKTVDVLELNSDGKRIAPNQTRTFTTNWKSGRAVGIYWAGLAPDQSSGVTGSDAVTFSVFPWWAIVGTPVFLVLVLMAVRFVWLKKA